MGSDGVYVRVRAADVRAIRLENRPSFTGLVSANLTLSANSTNPGEDCPSLAFVVDISDVRHPK